MSKPQRHRLLHGFPLAAAMPFASEEVRKISDTPDERFAPRHHPDRELLVGVLPHSFCNPKIAGCGFCTFPHEDFSSLKAAAVVNGVIREIESRTTSAPHLMGRSIHGLYFGGGTANLTPAIPFRNLCRKLNEVFDLAQAEVTLEGVPAYFLNRKPLLLDMRGFGPSGISCTEHTSRTSALKTMNPESAVEYLQAVQQGGTVWNRYYEFASGDLRLLHATRQLSALRIDRRRYQKAFGSDVCNDYAQEVETLGRAGLLDVTSSDVSLTTRGMFYADSVAAVLAHRQLGRGRDTLSSHRVHANDNSGGHM